MWFSPPARWGTTQLFNFFAQKSCAYRNFIYLCSPIWGLPQRTNNMVVVAQLVRALVCGTRGRGFESHLPPGQMEHRSFCCDVFLCPGVPASLLAEGHQILFLQFTVCVCLHGNICRGGVMHRVCQILHTSGVVASCIVVGAGGVPKVFFMQVLCGSLENFPTAHHYTVTIIENTLPHHIPIRTDGLFVWMNCCTGP